MTLLLPVHAVQEPSFGLHEDRYEAVDLAFAPVTLDMGTRGVMSRVRKEDIESFTDLPVDRRRLASQAQTQVWPTGDRRLIQAARVVGIAVQAC